MKGYQLLNLNTKVITASTWLYNAALNANPMGFRGNRNISSFFGTSLQMILLDIICSRPGAV